MEIITNSKPYTRLSEQQAVACANGNGCSGGNGYWYWQMSAADGSYRQADWPYIAQDSDCIVPSAAAAYGVVSRSAGSGTV